MCLRIVLYGEGGRDVSSPEYQPVAPGDPLPEGNLGPAHLLLRRCVVSSDLARGVAVRFDEPLRTMRGGRPKGAHLLDRNFLRELLTWANPRMQPDLAVVLVDRDGDDNRLRKNTMEAWVQEVPVPKIIAVAVQEFEAWLVADKNAVHGALGAATPELSPPEDLAAGEAKEALKQWILGSARPTEERDIRADIARTCILDTVTKRCPAFEDFRKEILTFLQSVHLAP